MSVLANKIMACVLLLAMLTAGRVCACADSEHLAVSPASTRDDDHDGDHQSDQQHHDDCQCITNLLCVTDQPVLSHLEPTISWRFLPVPVDLAVSHGLLLCANGLMIDPGQPPRLQTSLLRLHCALTV
jgi:hypothetical protein